MASIELTGILTEEPLNERGELFDHVLRSGDTTYFADTAAELLAFFIEDYDQIPLTEDGDFQAYRARFDFAVDSAQEAQEVFTMIEAAQPGRAQKIADYKDAWALHADRQYGVTLSGPWEIRPPLVLVATLYEPYAERPRPDGNVIFIDPYSERTLIESLPQIMDWHHTYRGAQG